MQATSDRLPVITMQSLGRVAVLTPWFATMGWVVLSVEVVPGKGRLVNVLLIYPGTLKNELLAYVPIVVSKFVP